jgi:hypothetical protein
VNLHETRKRKTQGQQRLLVFAKHFDVF